MSVCAVPCLATAAHVRWLEKNLISIQLRVCVRRVNAQDIPTY